MTKLINWLTRTIIQTMLVTGLTLYLTWVTVHTYVDKLLAKYHMNTDVSKIEFTDFLSQMSESLNILKPTRSNNQAAEETFRQTQGSDRTGEQLPQTIEVPKTTEIPPQADPEGSLSPKPSPEPTDANAASTKKVPDDSVSVWKQTSGESKQEAAIGKQKELVMSAEAFTKMKDQITEADKVKIFTLLATRLPQSEFQKISAYVEDGVTEVEWVEIQKSVEQYLKPEEYKELQDLLAHY
ncbi:MAG: hypothetical protein WD469_10170 [Paenibacillaceae bacterium]